MLIVPQIGATHRPAGGQSSGGDANLTELMGLGVKGLRGLG